MIARKEKWRAVCDGPAWSVERLGRYPLDRAVIATGLSEADAKLIAAAPAMHEALATICEEAAEEGDPKWRTVHLSHIQAGRKALS